MDPVEVWEALPVDIRAYIPQEDAWAIHPQTRRLKLAQETRRRYRMARVLATGVDTKTGKQYKPDEVLKKRDVFKATCAKDLFFFIENCIWTRDPEGKVGAGYGNLPLLVFGYARENWLEPWLSDLSKGEGRRTHDKSRRMLLSIYRMAKEVWCFRFVPGYKAWVSTDKENKLDAWYDFDSLLGKFRVMWDMCVSLYPWLFPELPPHSDVNKLKYLRFPEWKQGGHRIDESVWGNELKGVLPADPRGGAARDGFCDEAGWILEIKKLLDAAESMSSILSMGSSAPEDTENLFWKRRELPGVIHNTVPWWMCPLNLEGIHWSQEDSADMYPGQWRGPHTKRWRSKHYNKEASKSTSQEMGRNWDIDPRATAGARIFLNYDSKRVDGSKKKDDPTFDLYDPNLELQVWYDPGRGDPWALIWVQIDHHNGRVNVVDYDMGDDKTIHYFVPMLRGWPWASRHNWRTAPEGVPWDEAVKWPYDRDRIERMERWNQRRYHKGGRISIMMGDFYGTTHHGTDLYSVEERLNRYKIPTLSVPSNYRVNQFLEKADEVMLRTRISGFLVDFSPEGRHPPINQCFQFWRRQEKKETRAQPSRPLHDSYSHTGMAFTYGSHLLPTLIPGRVVDKRGTVEQESQLIKPGRMDTGPAMDRHTGWL